MKELNIIILWENGRYREEEIVNDLGNSFLICEKLEVRWEANYFLSNLARFYGIKLKSLFAKSQHCGTEPFLLITFIDNNPIYNNRNTSRGVECVNTNVFDKKQLYREWTGGGHKVHTTNGVHEINHDLALLCNMNQQTYMKELETGNLPLNQYNISKSTLVGHSGWSSYEELFTFLRSSETKYVVMRNYDSLFSTHNSDEHQDIDFLVEDAEEFAFLINAQKSIKRLRPNAYLIKVAERFIPIDLREIGDGYYDQRWQENILNTSILCSGVKIPSKKNFLPMLVYHALIHKVRVNDDYNEIFMREKISDLYSYTLKFLEKEEYKVTYPSDISVYFHYKNVKLINAVSLNINWFDRGVRYLRQLLVVHFKDYIKRLKDGK